MFSLDEITGKLLSLRERKQQEDNQRAEIRYGKEWCSLDAQIEELTKKRDALIASVPNCSEEYQAAETELIAAFKAAGVEEHSGIRATFKESKAVNTSRLLSVLDGDIDNFMSVASVTQVKLKELCKTFPEKKQPLMDCVEVVSREISGISFPTAA
jgi:hypothetical protein